MDQEAIDPVIVKKDKVIIALLMILIYFILDYSLKHIILQNYDEFLRFKSTEANPYLKTLALTAPFILTFLLIFLPSSNLIYCVLCVILVLITYPTFILHDVLNSDFRIVLLNILYPISIYLIANSFKLKPKLPRIAEQQKIPILFLIVIIGITPFVLIFAPYLDLRNLYLSNIDISRTLETQLSNRYTDYAYSSLSNVVIPLLMILALIKKEYFKTGIAFLLLILMFLVGGHKAVFFGAFLLLYFHYGDFIKKIKIFFWLVLLALSSVVVIYWINGDLFPIALITRRVFFLPAVLEIGYFDFFDGKPLYWSDSILRNIVPYEYVLSPKNIIGKHVLLNPITNANNGIISDGFMNLGILGAVLNIISVSFVYCILNSLNISHRFFGLIFLLLFTFYSSYFFTSMITHGGLLLIILAIFFLKNTHKSYDGSS